MINKVIKDSNNVTLDEIILTGGSSKIPKLQAMIQNLFKTKRLNTQMNAHSVAFGASICSFQFYENRISYSLGFEKKYAKFSKIIHKGSILPFKSSRVVQNSAKKKEINIRVFKGEKTIVLDNKFIFSKTYYSTDSISIRESCYLEIEFDVDSFGILNISVQMIIYSEKGKRRKSSLIYTQDKSYIYLYLAIFLLFSLFNVKNIQKFLLSPLPKRKANEVFYCFYNNNLPENLTNYPKLEVSIEMNQLGIGNYGIVSIGLLQQKNILIKIAIKVSFTLDLNYFYN